MKTNQKSTEKNPQSERDFISEYQEMFLRLGYDLKASEIEWNKKSNHFKEFTLLKQTPTPFITNNIITE
jgi:hypothetical protein